MNWSSSESSAGKLGLIAGNGRFPFLLLDAARAHGLEVVVAAIRVHWRLLDPCPQS